MILCGSGGNAEESRGETGGGRKKSIFQVGMLSTGAKMNASQSASKGESVVRRLFPGSYVHRPETVYVSEATDGHPIHERCHERLVCLPNISVLFRFKKSTCVPQGDCRLDGAVCDAFLGDGVQEAQCRASSRKILAGRLRNHWRSFRFHFILRNSFGVWHSFDEWYICWLSNDVAVALCLVPGAVGDCVLAVLRKM